MMPEPKSIVDIQKGCLQKLHHESWRQKGIEADVLRIDRIHPVISGNKWFKLKYYLEAIHTRNKMGILTFGGAWSNHIHSAAHICGTLKLKSVGVIRGERPKILSPTLIEAEQSGMKLIFISRQEYHHIEKSYQKFEEQFRDLILVPEGAADETGIRGAAEILDRIDIKSYSHFIAAAGTGTMCAGILRRIQCSQQVLVIPVLKFVNEEESSVKRILSRQITFGSYQVITGYHFGGYAKYTDELIQFMNQFYASQQVPSDVVYTSKMFYGFMDLIKNNFFKNGDKILLIHSGGLQGNRSISHRLDY